ncbi:hypothetical protein CXF68_17475 [Tenacibaculum sp. Bg11-29]|uniref:hypothetical protein n=1 Tax=Tenacibaculum sp. Bg11-29 TaxID=2058306 RepID=UPI000C33B4BE|nr:hypothetical protein [Tenacibaculum sp. Bg11-29]PKH52376.1 hypothetical protein CXF68_17475 [Tenacibaculum sp. Bg11-29]
MEEKNKQLKSVWGKWWESIRKWFYPIWLLYELSIKFYNYSETTYYYFIAQNYISEQGLQILAIFCSVASFIICNFFLTLPACFILYKFFKIENLTNTQFENKIKKYF